MSENDANRMSDAPAQPAAGRGRRLLRPALWTVGVLAVLAGAVHFGVPPLARHYGTQILSGALGREVSIERVRFNPLTLTAEAHGVKVMEADGVGEALGFDMLRANLELESLVRGGAVLHELALAGPRLNVVLEGEGRHNWSDVFEHIASMAETEDAAGETLFSVGNIRITGGKVAVDDRVRGLRHELDAIELGLPFISNLPVKVDVFVEPVLSATLDGNPLELSAKAKPFIDSRDTILDVELKAFDLAPWAAYLPADTGFRLPSGLLTTKVELSFAQQPGQTPRLSLRGPVQIERLELQDKAGEPVLKMAELGFELADVEPMAGKWHFTRLRLMAPELDLVRLKNGDTNLTGLLPASAEPAEAAAKRPQAPVDFLLSDARIRDGVVRFEDRSLAQPFATRIEALNLDMRDLANTGELPADIRFDYATDAGEKVTHEARLRLAPIELEGTVALEGVRLARYAPYAALGLPGGELRGGELGANLSYRLAADEGGMSEAGVTVETLALKDFALALRGGKTAALTVPQLDLRQAEIDIDARSVKVAELGLKGMNVSAVRLKNGDIDLMGLLGQPGAKPASAPARGKAAEPEWAVTVARLALEGGAVRLEDRSVAKPVVLAIDGIGLTLEDVSTLKGVTTRLQLDSRINRSGRALASGELALSPLKADLRVDLRTINLLPLQPYVLDKTRIAISRGSLDAWGLVNLRTAPDGRLLGTYRGDIGVNRFASIDRNNSTEFVRWGKLRVEKIDSRLDPFRLGIGRIALDDFYTRLILDEAGRLNLREIQAGGADQRDEPATTPSAVATKQDPFVGGVIELPGGAREAAGKRSAELPAQAAPAPPISIARIEFRRGNIAFSDRFIRPNYDVNLTGMSGTLLGLSSDPSTIAKLDLSGKVDNTAPVTVVGELNPFRQDSHLDITGTVKGFELTGLSSYSGKYVGYGIARGQLSAEVKYKVEDRKLTATNQIFLDQLEFGDKVDSPDAVNLPVRLAVSLLKNRDGEIDLHLPISGTLDDPQFSVFGLVVKALFNLVGKAITAPFSLLASALGGGEELSQLELAPGAALPGEAQAKKLSALASALNDRPALRLDVTGRADPALDAEGLKRAMLEREVQAQKLKAMMAAGQEAPPLEDIEVGADEYPELLKKAYRAADFKKPRNLIGLTKDLPVPEMEALMRANVVVGEAELRALAQQRAQAVREWLVGEGAVPGERVFVLEPKVEPLGEGGQVQFSLR